MKYSFVIPVANDNKILKCIESFLSAKLSEQCECLIICNGTDRKLFSEIRRRCKYFSNIKIIRCKRSNIALARNLGVLFATGEYIVWADSDCVIDNNYVINLMADHHDEEIIRGNLRFNNGTSLFQKTNAWLRSLYYDDSVAWCWTPNLVIKKAVYSKVGLFFDEVSGAEDGEWDWRARDFGYYAKKYSPELRMEHDADSPKKTLRTWHFYGRGQAYRLKRSRLLRKLPLDQLIRLILFDLKFLKFSNNFMNNCFLLYYFLVKTAAFCYSWVINWSALTHKGIIDRENFLRSGAFRDLLKQEVEFYEK